MSNNDLKVFQFKFATKLHSGKGLRFATNPAISHTHRLCAGFMFISLISNFLN
jgi:hypothetical protein